MLNRKDLVKLLYAMLIPERLKIDQTSLDELPLLVNEEWSVPELKERVIDRMRVGE